MCMIMLRHSNPSEQAYACPPPLTQGRLWCGGRSFFLPPGAVTRLRGEGSWSRHRTVPCLIFVVAVLDGVVEVLAFLCVPGRTVGQVIVIAAGHTRGRIRHGRQHARVVIAVRDRVAVLTPGAVPRPREWSVDQDTAPSPVLSAVSSYL